jgi:phage replication-related protein YjqB (UPF0714/DUF867 family)
MGTSLVSVKKALSRQRNLIARKEHCSADLDCLRTVGLAVGHQARVVRDKSHYALYTISETRQENPSSIVRMGAAARQRLGVTVEFPGTLGSRVTHPTFTDTEAKANSEFVERLDDDGKHDGLIVIAPHGGDIEKHTDEQAERLAWRLASKGVSSWRCKGWKRGGGARDRWHITSTDIHEASFSGLRGVITRGFTYAIAFHGLHDSGSGDILIGGRAPLKLKQELERAIAAVASPKYSVQVFRASDPLGGHSRRNIVNRLTSGGTNGVHIEQKRKPRTDLWQEIADAVAEVYRQRLP